MAEMAGFILKVTPEQLEQKATEIEDIIADIKREFGAIEDNVTAMGKYWIGLASQKNQSMYDEQKEEIDQILKRLGEHPGDLLKMAGVYRQAEKENVEAAGTLLDNIIE